MVTILTDSLKLYIKNSTQKYSYLVVGKGMPSDEALVYSLLDEVPSDSTFLRAVYSLLDVTPRKISYDIDDKMSEKSKLSYCNERKAVVEELCKRFIMENMNDFNGNLNINIEELICLLIIYYPKQVKDVLVLNESEYLKLKEVLVCKLKDMFSNQKNGACSFQKDSEESREIFKSLLRFGAEDLTQTNYNSCPYVGNQQAIKKAIKYLLTGKSLIILGDGGVGKTTLVEGIAYNISIGNVPSYLKDKKIIRIPLSGVIANTEYSGELEKHVNCIINYGKVEPEAILFFDEIHTIVGAGRTKDSRVDVSNLLKPYLSDGTLQIIGATTKNEFHESIALDSALRRRFNTMILAEPTKEQIFDILKNYISIKEADFGISWWFNDRFLNTLVELTSSKNIHYYEDVKNPVISMGLIDGIFASAAYAERDYVDSNDVLESIEDNELLSLDCKKKLREKMRVSNFDDLYVCCGEGNKTFKLLLPGSNGNM